MKRLIQLIAICFCFSLSASGQGTDYRKEGALLPPFLLSKPGGGTFANTQLNTGQPVVVVLFDPTCTDCEPVFNLLREQNGQLGNVQIVMVAAGKSREQVQAFLGRINAGATPVFRNVGTDMGNFSSKFGAGGGMQVLIYNENHRLVKVLEGSNLSELLQDYLSQSE